MTQIAADRYIAARNAGDTKGAIAALLECLAEEPEAGVIHSNLAIEYAKDGKPKEAEDSARRGVELQPEFWYAHHALAICLLHHRKLSAAEEANNRALELAPQNASVLEIAVRIGEFRRDDATVEAVATRFIEAHPTAAGAHVAFGGLHYRKGQTGAARSAALRALEYDPEFANAHMLLALIDLELQRRDEARACVATVLRLNPQHALAQSVAKNLREPKIKVFKDLGRSASPRFLLLTAMAGLLVSGTVFSLLPLYFGDVDEKWLLLLGGLLVFAPLLRADNNLRAELPARERIYLNDAY